MPSSPLRNHSSQIEERFTRSQEALLQEARGFKRSEAFSQYRQLRQAAEHRIARLMQLGARQARYFGRLKTLYQLLMAATVANLTLVATKVGLMGGRDSRRHHLFARIVGAVLAFIATLTLSIVYNLDLIGHTRSRQWVFV